MVLDAAGSYLARFFGDLPELKPLYKRIDNLKERIWKIDTAHEQWLDKDRKEDSE